MHDSEDNNVIVRIHVDDAEGKSRQAVTAGEFANPWETV